MSVSVLASLRPLHGQCLQNANRGLLSIRLQSRAASVHVRAVIPLGPNQLRFNSSSPADSSKDLDNQKNQVPKNQQQAQNPPITFRKFAGRAMGAGIRSLVFAVSPSGIKTAYKQSPGATVLALGVLLAVACMGAYTVQLYFTYFYSNQFTRYPAPIANSLRRALYYTNIKPEPELALKYYKRAIDQCDEHGLDPFSDDVLGIRIQTTVWLQKIQNPKGAAAVLESVRNDLLRWLAAMDKLVSDGGVTEEGRLVKPPAPKEPATPEGTTQKDSEKQASAGKGDEEDEESVPESLWHKRRRLLSKAVSTSVKLGQLYSNEYLLDPDNSQKHLLWAVETSLKEFRRRQTEGVKPDEGEWLSPEEFGGALEELGRDYESKSQFHLAIPLFFQALRLCDKPCHRAVIMNNLAATFAQYPIMAPVATLNASPEQPDIIKELQDSSMPTTRKACLEAATNWAKNAYLHAQDVKGEDRTPECDEACAVALCNWGDVAALSGNEELARKKYNQCLDMSAQLDFPEAAKQAKGGLARLASASSK